MKEKSTRYSIEQQPGKENIKIVHHYEHGFPERLKGRKGMPKQLYYIGELPPDAPTVAIVGARSCSPYGRARARELGQYLAEHGVAVVSGMAEGIDGYAHEGTLLGSGKTYAVLGSGPDICYPRSHYGLYRAIPASGGGILSEYPPGTPPLPARFPARNRIISALSDVVVVVEARKRSGSLITADFALEQGKTVLAFPGRCGDRLSEGTNSLIAQGAGIVSSFESVLFELWHSGGYAAAAEKEKAAEMAQKEKKPSPEGEKDTIREEIYEILRYDAAAAEDLLPYTHGDSGMLHSVLLDLILEGKIVEISPGIYAGR